LLNISRGFVVIRHVLLVYMLCCVLRCPSRIISQPDKYIPRGITQSAD
jgi:hypothetical protein